MRDRFPTPHHFVISTARSAAAFGPIAPRAENYEEPKEKNVTEKLLEDLDRMFPDDDPIDQIHATTRSRKHEHNRRSRRRKLATRTSQL